MTIPSNEKNENYTPVNILKVVKEFFEIIHLDPFSSDLANKSVGAQAYFTEETNGLTTDWNDFGALIDPLPNIWINPPYSRKLIGKCIDKTLEYTTSSEVLLLVNSETTSKWYQKCLERKPLMLLPDKRMKFINPYNAHKSSANKPQTMFYFGFRKNAFRQQFEHLGSICQPL